MKLIVGLGNPGTRFNWTRHNLGFTALDFYFKRYILSWEEKPHLGAINGRRDDIFFIKPQDFYNLSGQAVAAYAKYYKIPLESILVICDNFDLKFGELRYRSRGSTGGNNGLKSVDRELGSAGYPRLRIGTENAELKAKMGATDFVLSKFTPEEKALLPEVLEKACEKIDEFIKRQPLVF